MAVDLDDSAVDHGVFEVGVFGQGSEYPVESIRLNPSAEPLEHRVPFTELLRQVTPRTARPGDPQHRLDEEPRVRARATGITFPAKAVRADERPLRIGQGHADQGHLHLATLNHFALNMGILKRQQTLGAPIARASSVKTSNIGTLDALAGSVKQPFMQSAAKSDSEPFSPDPNRRRKTHRRHFVARSIEKDGLRRSSPNVRCVALCVYKPSGCALRRIRLGAMAIDHAPVRSLKVAKNVSHSEQ